MIDVTKFPPPFPPGSAMRAVMDHVASEKAPLPSGVAPADIGPPPKYDPTPDLVAASLAAGMIAAGGKAISAEEAVGIWRGVRERL